MHFLPFLFAYVKILSYICSIIKTITMNDYLKQYYEQRDKRLEALGFTDLTDEQKDLILQREEAPENYMCDGEITPRQAFQSWVYRLKNSGLNQTQINLVIKNF